LLHERDELHRRLAAENTAETHRLLGDIEENLGNPVEAVREYEKAARLDPSEQNYFFWGTELLLHHAIQPAIGIFSKASASNPLSARLAEGLGAALYAGGAYDEAARALCRASDLRPTDSAPCLLIGKLETSLADPPPCGEQRLARFAQTHTQNAMANYYYAVALLKPRHASDAEATSKAEALLLKATNIDANLAEARLQLGILYAARNEFPAAISAFERAIHLNPSLPEAHYRLARVLRSAGEEARAQTEIQAYRDTEKSQAAEFYRERRELKQFMIVLKDQAVVH
jgi:tetratricopeptide (TPR) repeat protein